MSYSIEDCVCDEGYYRFGDLCYGCMTGYYCTGGIETPCSENYYCDLGATE